jgi:hypothetical protein
MRGCLQGRWFVNVRGRAQFVDFRYSTIDHGIEQNNLGLILFHAKDTKYGLWLLEVTSGYLLRSRFELADMAGDILNNGMMKSVSEHKRCD